MAGISEWPPASTLASGSLARIAIASSTLDGRTYSNCDGYTPCSPFLVGIAGASAASSTLLFCLVHCHPDSLRGHWHLNILDAQVPHRVDHCIRDGRRRRNRSGLTGALGSPRIDRAWR